MTTGPNGPSALANIIRISEHDVDWIAAAITYMQKSGMGTIEPTVQAEDAWMEIVRSIAQRSLINKAKTWWVGANVKDKPQGLTMFTGGFLKYREYCAATANDGYRGFHFEPVEQTVEA